MSGGLVAARAAVRRRLRPLLRAATRLDPGAPPALRHGVGVPAADGGPVVLVALLGADDEAAARHLEVLRQVQWAHGSLVPVVLVDTPVLQVFRRAGYVVELSPPGRLDRALAEARRTVEPDLVVVLADAAAATAPTTLGAALLGVGPAPRRPWPRRAARRVLGRL